MLGLINKQHYCAQNAIRSRLAGLAIIACISIIVFMTMGVKGQWGFVLPFRGSKLLAMMLVAISISVSSVLFHTITHNRVLTPSIMGFDALYVLIQAITIFIFGMQAINNWHPSSVFVIETTIMTAFSVMLFKWVFTGAMRSLHLVILVGIVFGLLFRSLSSFVLRMIDPNEFLILQDRMFASFNSIHLDLIAIASLLIVVSTVLAWRQRHMFDVLALGRQTSINLGVPYGKAVMFTLLLIAVLVSVSTALVGPVTFFGLLVSNLAYMLIPSSKHKHILPASILIAVVFLVGGQTILERLLKLNTTISVVIELIGGLMFIYLIIRKPRNDYRS